MEFDEPDFALIDTLFSLAEAHLFMQLIELQDNHPEKLPPGKTCADIYRCCVVASAWTVQYTLCCALKRHLPQSDSDAERHGYSPVLRKPCARACTGLTDVSLV